MDKYKNLENETEYKSNFFFKILEGMVKAFDKPGLKKALGGFGIGVVLIFPGCAKKIIIPSPTKTVVQEATNSTPKPKDNIANPSATPTTTPESTVSEPTEEEKEQAKIMDEYNRYKEFYDKYKDDYALLFIKEMVNDGRIPASMLDELKGPFSTITDIQTEADFWEFYKDKFAILNGEKETMQPGALDTVNGQLLEDSYEGILRVTYLKTDEQRERLITAVNTVNEWYDNPTDDNRIKMEDAYFSEELTLGEEEILFQWMLSKVINKEKVQVDGVDYQVGEYMTLNIDRYGTTMGKRHLKSYDALIEFNNTPNSEKEQSSSTEEETAYNQGYEDGQVAFMTTHDFEGNPAILISTRHK